MEFATGTSAAGPGGLRAGSGEPRSALRVGELLRRAIGQQLDELGLRARPEWRGLISAFETFARELHRHMREEEALLDRAQFLMVRQQLCFGAMSDARGDFDALREEHERMDVLRRRLERELAQTSADAPTVRAALREYVAAFVDHHDFEARALWPVPRRAAAAFMSPTTSLHGPPASDGRSAPPAATSIECCG